MKVINIFNMKKIIYKSIFVLSILIFNFSCDDVERVYLNADAETILSLSADNVTLTEDTALNEILTASWTEPDFGFDAAALYTVLIDYQGGDFSEAQIVPAGSNLDMSFTVEELNAKMLSLGLTPNEATSVSFMVRVTLSEYQEMYSNTVSLSVTPYSSLLDLFSCFKHILSVLIALLRQDTYTLSNSILFSDNNTPAFFASLIPFFVKSTSVQPVNIFW